jgi:hypothetical protein
MTGQAHCVLSPMAMIGAKVERASAERGVVAVAPAL